MSTRTAFFKAIADFSSISRESAKAVVSLDAVAAAEEAVGAASVSSSAVVIASTGRARDARGRFLKQGTQVEQAAKSEARALDANAGGFRRGIAAIEKWAASHGKAAKTADKLKSSASGLGKAMQALEHETGQAVSKSNSLAGGLLQVISRLGVAKTATLALGTALAIVAAGAAAFGVAANAQFETLELGFTSILQSGPKAKELMKTLIEIARVTPFQTTDLADVTRKLLAVGFTVDQIFHKTKDGWEGLAITIGDAVAAMGGSPAVLEAVSRAVYQIKAKGKADAQELRQLAEAGIPAYQILAEQLHLTGEEVSNIGDQGITADRAIEALATGLNARFGGAMAKQAKTLVGLISTLKDNLIIGSASLFKGAFDQVKGVVEDVGSLLTRLNERSAQVGWMKAIEEESPAVAAAIGAVMEAVNGLFDLLGALGRASAPVAVGFAKIAGPAIIAALRGLGTVLSTLAKIIDHIPGPLLQMVGAMAGTIFVVGHLTSAFTSLILLIPRLAGALAGASAGLTAFAAANPILLGLVVTVGVLVGGMALLDARAKKVAAAHDSATESAKKLTDSLDNEKAAFDTTTAATSAGIKALQDWAKENSNAIKQLRALNQDPEGQKAFLLQIGLSLVQGGTDPVEALKQLNDLAKYVFGQTYELKINADDLVTVKSILPGVADAIVDIQKQVNKANEDLKTDTQGYTDLGTKVKENIESIGNTIGKALNDPAQTAGAIQAIESFQTQLYALGYSAQANEDILNRFFDAVGRGSGNTKGMKGDLSDIDELMKALTGDGSNLKGETLALLQAFQAGGGFKNPEQALAALRAEQERQTAASKNAIKVEGGVAKAFEFSKETFADYEDRVKLATKALGDFVDPLDVLGQALDDMTDDQEKFAKKTATSLGLGEDSWEQFAIGAGVSLNDYSNRLEAALINQELWQRNIAAVSARFGDDIGQLLLQAGPKMAGVAAALVDAPTEEAGRLVGLLREDAKRGTEQYGTEFAAGLARISGALGGEWEKVILALNKSAPGIEQAMVSPFEAADKRIRAILASLPIVGSSPSTTPGSGGYGLGGTDPYHPTAGTYNEDGSIEPKFPAALRQFYAGGFTPDYSFKPGGFLPEQARIQKPEGAGGLVQWAEKETKGEAFIPLSPLKRKRSTEIWWETGRRLGIINQRMDLTFMAMGGFTNKKLKKVGQAPLTLAGADGGVLFADGGFHKMAGGGIIDMGETVIGEGPTGGAVAVPTPAQVYVPPSRAELEARQKQLGLSIKTTNEMEKQKDLSEEIAKNFRDWQRDNMGTLAAIADIDQEMSGLVAWTNEWVALLRERNQLLEKQQQLVDETADKLNGLLDEVADNRKAVLEAERDAQKAHVKASQDYLDDVASIQKDAAKAQLDAAKQRDKALADLAKQSAKQRSQIEKGYADQLKAIDQQFEDQLKQRTDALTSALDPMDAYEKKWGNTTQSIIDNMAKQNEAYAKSQAGINELKAKGVSEDVFNLLDINGPEDLGQIEELLKSSPEQLAKLNELAASRRASAGGIVAATAGDLEKQREEDKAAAAQDLADSLAELDTQIAESQAEIQANYQEQLDQIAETQAEALAEALKRYQEQQTQIDTELRDTLAKLAEDLAKIGKDTGRAYGDAIKEGLGSTIPEIRALAETLKGELDILNQAKAKTGTAPSAGGPVNTSPGGGGGGAPTDLLSLTDPYGHPLYYKTTPPQPIEYDYEVDRGERVQTGDPNNPYQWNWIAPYPPPGMSQAEMDQKRANGEVIYRHKGGFAWPNWKERSKQGGPTMGGAAPDFTTQPFTGGGFAGTPMGFGHSDDILGVLQRGEGIMTRDVMRDIGRSGVGDPADIVRGGGGRLEAHLYIDGKEVHVALKAYRDEDRLVDSVRGGRVY